MNKPTSDHLFLVNNYTKTYPDKIRLFNYAKPFGKLKPNMELQPEPDDFYDLYFKSSQLKRILTEQAKLKQAKAPPIPMNPDSVHRSLNRTRTKIADLIMCNEFTHFGTFTFGHKYCQTPCDKTTANCKRFDDELMRAKLTQFLNHEQRKGKFQYLIVPERHKSGALHFHGLFKDYPGELKMSGVLEGGRQVYNMTNFKTIGHNNFTVIESLGATANYCRKYITKAMANDKGRRRYWHSKDLQTPSIAYNVDPFEILDKSTSQPTTKAHNPNSYTVLDFPTSPSSHTGNATNEDTPKRIQQSRHVVPNESIRQQTAFLHSIFSE